MSEQFGRYRPIFQVGPNDYVAEDPLLNRKVYIQVGPPNSPELQLWGRQLALVGGPLVQRLHDLGMDSEKSYLVREVVEGRSLEEIGPDRSLLPALREALAHVHKAGLQHGDLRPASIIVTPEGVLRLTHLCYQGRDDGEALRELEAWFDTSQ